MLFHVLRHDASGQTQGYDIEQVHLVLNESLELEPFERAWALVTQRHPVLSSSFDWTEGDVPEQRIHPGLVVPVESLKLGGADGCATSDAMAGFLTRDRARGFDLRSPPLQRVTALVTDRGATEFVWTFHHLLLDGRSFGRVLSEVFTAYESLRTASPIEQPPLPRPFRDYAEWLRSRQSVQESSYFRELLCGKQAPTPLPRAQFTAGQSPGLGYSRIARKLGIETTRLIGELALRSRTSLSTVVQAAWAIVLARFTGDPDVLFGVSLSGRSALDGDARAMVGIFTNTLPLRVRVEEATSVLDLLTAIRHQALALRAVEHVPLVEIQRQSEIPAGKPLFSCLLLFEDQDLATQLRASKALGERLEAVSVHEQPAFPLTLKVVKANELDISLLFDKTQLLPSLVERLLEALAFTAQELAENEHAQLDQLLALPASERDKLLVQWNDTAGPFPEHLLLHQLFESWASATPDAVAVEVDGETLSYGQLDRRSNRLAHALRARGARPGHYVGICLRRRADLIVSMLAVSKSGAAYLPIEPHHPAERIRSMLADCAAELVVTESRFEHLFSTPRLVLDDAAVEHDLASLSPSPPEPTFTPSTECYVIYTSGSTGTPKGVVLSHRAVVNTLDWVNRTFDVAPGDRLLFVTSPAFDLSVYDVFGALGAGATLVLATEAQLANPEVLATVLLERKISIWNSAPSALELVMPLVEQLTSAPEPISPSLRLVLLSGDWISLDLVRSTFALFPTARLISLGGATEAAIWSNWFPIDRLEPHWVSIPYGRPIRNCRYYALDDRLRPVPVGAIGELHIGGDCVAEGYLGRPELTAARFVDDPFSKLGRGRLYRTGDLVRYFEDGNLELLGRADMQLKIRGFRVEIAEVEAALANLPELQHAVCSARRDAAGQKSVVAHVVARAGHARSEESVKRALARTLPDYMIPARVLFVRALPLTPNGKIDRNALPSASEPPESAPLVALGTDTERRLAAIWERVLERSPIGGSDDFFKLGGHSLLAIRVFVEIAKAFGVRIHLDVLFDNPTIASLAARIDALKNAASSAETEALGHTRLVVPIHPGGSLPPLFCVASATGNLFGEARLAAALGGDQAFYVLQYRSGNQLAPRARTIPLMAREFLQAIRGVQPRGPYRLSGYSAGGVLAFEMARLLREEGEEVPLLALLDAFNPNLPKWSYTERLTNFFRLGYHYGPRYASQRLAARVRFSAERMRHKLPVHHSRSTDLRLRDYALQAEISTALECYVPGEYGGNTLLIRSSGPCPDVDYRTDPGNGWGAVLRGPLQIVTVPYRHDQLLDANVDSTALRIRQALASIGAK